MSYGKDIKGNGEGGREDFKLSTSFGTETFSEMSRAEFMELEPYLENFSPKVVDKLQRYLSEVCDYIEMFSARDKLIDTVSKLKVFSRDDLVDFFQLYLGRDFSREGLRAELLSENYGEISWTLLREFAGIKPWVGQEKRRWLSLINFCVAMDEGEGTTFLDKFSYLLEFLKPHQLHSLLRVRFA